MALILGRVAEKGEFTITRIRKNMPILLIFFKFSLKNGHKNSIVLTKNYVEGILFHTQKISTGCSTEPNTKAYSHKSSRRKHRMISL